MALRPVRLEPLFVPRIWGSRNLSPLFPEKKSLSEPIGEVWLTGNECRFADGPFAGQRLRDTWPQMGADWIEEPARRDKQFPVLAKFIFPEDKLSVQVHPDDDYAARHEAERGGTGKTEMWYVVSASPGAEVRVGFKPEVTAEGFRRAIHSGRAEEMLERIPVSGGDAIFVPAGTVHTIGPGMILCEIQQNSDITYRVHDFGRMDVKGKPRELHIEKAFDVICFQNQHGGKISPARREDKFGEISVLVDCPYFAVVKHRFATSRYSVKPEGHLKIVVILDGCGTLRTEPGSERIAYAPAQAWLIPAALRDCVYEPQQPTKFLSVVVPRGDTHQEN